MYILLPCSGAGLESLQGQSWPPGLMFDTSKLSPMVAVTVYLVFDTLFLHSGLVLVKLHHVVAEFVLV